MKFIMSTLGIISSLSVGVIGFLFLVWRRLKEDYSSNNIFSFCFIVLSFMLTGFLVGIFLGSVIKPSNIFRPTEIWFWFSVIFGFIGFIVAIYSMRLRFYEALEAVIQGFLFWLFIIFINFSVLIAIFIIVLVFSFGVLNKNYRKFTWYKSGKVGFSGLFLLGVFFFARTIIALINPNIFSFVGRFDAIPSVIATFIAFITLYNLSGI